MKFLSDILARAGLVVDGTVTLNSVANATTDTDKFLTIDSGVVKFRTGAQLLLDIGGQVAGSYVPTSRILTINGTAYDLSADRSWTITAGVSSVSAGNGISVNSTTGAVTVTNTGLLSATAGSGISVSTVNQNLNIVNTGLLTATAGAGISVSTVNQNLNIVNTGLLTATAGSGISVSVVGQNLNIVSTGVLTATAGSGISLSVVGQNLNVVNTGILTATAGAGISLSVVSGNLNVVNTITNNNQLTNGAGYITLSALNGYATETYVGIQISNLVDAAPGTLNTLNELAAALGDDPNFATTVATSIGNKVSKSGDTMTGNLTSPAFIKSDGTSSEFLKADGSVDSSVYLTTTSAATLYVPYSGATTDVNLNTKNLLLGQGSVGSYILMVGNAGTNYLQIENAGNRTRYQMDSLIFTNKQFGGTKTIYFNTSASTGTNYTISFPDKNGTVAMTSDIPSYTETDTLASVTARGASTNTSITVGPDLVIQADGGVNYTASRLKLNSHNNYRGAGMHLTGVDSNWFIGTPYTDFSGGFVIARKSSAASFEDTAQYSNALFTVKSDGKVGIGTTSVTAKLHVVANSNQDGFFVSAADSSPFNAKIATFRYAANGNDVNIEAQGGKAAIQARAGASTMDLLLNAAGGYVGIGTVSPSAKLHVEGTFINNGTTGDVAYISSTFATSATNGRVLHIRDNKAAVGTDSYVSIGWTSSPGQDVYIGKRTTSGAGFLAIQNSSATELFTINLSSGNVGVQVSNPTNKLQIGSVGSSGYGGNDIVIGNGTQVMAFYQSSTISTWYTNTNFSLMPSGSGATGNLAVGISTPLYRVDIGGSLRLTGALVLDDATSNVIQHRAGTDVNTLVTVGHGGFDHNGYLRIGGANVATQSWVQSQGYITPNSTVSGWIAFQASTQGTTIIRAVQQDTTSGYYLFQGITGSTEMFRVDRTGSGYFANKISVGTTYAGFAANINGTLYVIGGQIYVNDGYQIQNTSGNAIIQFNSSALAFTGAATFSSSITCTALTETSTIKVKENIVSIDSALDQVEKLQAVSYNRKGSSIKEIGLIAEAVEEVYPEFVQYDQNGEPVGLNYSRLTAVLIESVKELKKEIDLLKENRN